jgi:uncharacterized protein YndB with AHSA1/START domain
VHHEVTVAIPAPAARAWSILADVEQWPSWTASMRRVELDGPFAVNSVARIRQPRLAGAAWTITGIDPGRSFTWRSVAPGIRSVATHLVTPTGDGTCDVTLSIDQTGPLAGFFGLLYGRLTKRYVQMELDGLAGEAVRG